jgi:hypothetical protein
MLGVIEHVPAALFIEVTPVPLTTEQAFDNPEENVTNPSELEDGVVVALTVAELPYFKLETAVPAIVREARLTVRVPVAYVTAVYESLFVITADAGVTV